MSGANLSGASLAKTNMNPNHWRVPAERGGKDLLLLDLPGWLTAALWHNFCPRYREDLAGFALAWLTVALLVLTAWGLMQLGKQTPMYRIQFSRPNPSHHVGQRSPREN